MKINFKDLPEIFAFDLPGETLKFELTVVSYTAANVAKGSLSPTLTHLGSHNAATLDLQDLIQALSEFSQHDPYADYAAQLGHTADQFWLGIELVAQPRKVLYAHTDY